MFYDGDCGLCHRAVKFVLAGDRQGLAFRFAPIQGETIKKLLSEDQRRGLPDTVIVLRADGALLLKSAAFLHILARLGGAWRAASVVLRLFPASWLDAAYDFVARVRHRIFRKPRAQCPLLPKELRARFDR